MITIQLTVTAAAGAPRVPLAVEPDITPTDLRKEAARVTKIPIAIIKLIVRGRLVADNDTLSAVTEYKLEEGSVLHCMGKPEEDTSTVASSAPTGGMFSVPTVSGSSASASASSALAPEDPLQAALAALRAANPPTVYQTAVSTLDKILSNIIENPMEEKYRSLKVQNAAFQKRLGGLPGGNAAILACGFTVEKVDGEDKYCMAASADKWTALVATKAAVAQAVAMSNGSNSSGAGTGSAAMPMPGFGAFGGSGLSATSPQMRQAAAGLASNPQHMQAMLQNPMVRTMLRNDPSIRGNPMLEQAIDELANNPDLAAQLSQMTADPRMQQMMQNPEQMQQMMEFAQRMQSGGGGGGSLGAAAAGGMPMGLPNWGAAPPGAATGTSAANRAAANNNAGNNGGEDDADQTEEEMIAEAIRRSLQDGQGP